jgi:hypothetical protein
MIDAARRVVIERHLSVELVLGDAASTGLPRASFDLVHARLLLVNILSRTEVVDEMTALTRPGGSVALQEVDIEYFVCDPPHPAWETLRGAFVDAHRATGREVTIGRRLGRLLDQAGLVDIHSTAHIVKTRPGDAGHHNLPRLTESARALIQEASNISDTDLNSLIADAQDYLDNPHSTTAIAFWQARARKPS